MHPNDGFRHLERQECLRLLAKAPVGRIVHTRRALPAVLPVNFSLDTDGAVLLCTSAASELVRAIAGAVVALAPAGVDPPACCSPGEPAAGQGPLRTGVPPAARPGPAPGCWAKGRGLNARHRLSLPRVRGRAARPASRRATGTRNGEQET